MKSFILFGLIACSFANACRSLEKIPDFKPLSAKHGGFEVVVVPNATRAIFPSAVAVGSFSGGRLPDFAITAWGDFRWDTTGGVSDGSLAILRGENPQGRRFAPVDEYDAGRSAGSVAVGDFNRDGKLDLAVAAMNSQTGIDRRQQLLMNPGDIRIFFGNGDGTFERGPTISSPVSFPVSISVSDFNRDGYLDLVVGSQSSSNKAIGVLFGDHKGQFRPLIVPVAGAYSRSVALGQFGDKGYTDIVVAHGSESGTPSVSVLINNGAGDFTTQQILLPGYTISSIAVGDFNRDGKDDFVVHTKEALLLYTGDGKGNFSRFRVLPGEFVLSSVRISDFDKDGNVDILVPTSRLAFSILFGDGEGGFTRRLELRAQFKSRLLQEGALGSPSRATPVSGTSETWDLVLTTPFTTPEVADIDGDGYLDVIIPAAAMPFEEVYFQRSKIQLDQKDAGGFLAVFLNRLSP